jgi:serine/threonine protein kinase
MDAVFLARGSFGSVSLVNQTEVRTKDGLTFEKNKMRAVKVGKISDAELEILQAGIKNIPKYVSHKQKNEGTAVTMQVARRAEIKKADLLKVVEGVSRAVVELNYKFKSDGKLKAGERVIHHDIKPENIGMTKGGKIKLLDWGSAKIVSDSVMTPPDEGATYLYIPPEGYCGVSASEKNDSWALGATLLKYATGKPVIERMYPVAFMTSVSMLQSEEALKAYLGESEMDQRTIEIRTKSQSEFQANLMEVTSDPEIDEKAKMLILRLLDTNPETRLSLEDALHIIEESKAPETPDKNTSPEARTSSELTFSSVSASDASESSDSEEIEEELEHLVSELSLDGISGASEVQTDEDCLCSELAND